MKKKTVIIATIATAITAPILAFKKHQRKALNKQTGFYS